MSPDPVETLRQRLYPDRKAGTAIWIPLTGLGVDRVDAHSALLRALTAFGLGDGDGGRTPPAHAVLDWTRVDGTSAEALAFFPVLVRTLVGQGVRVTVCEPADGDVVDALAASGVRDELAARCSEVGWVACACDGRPRRVEALVPAAFFAGALGKGGVRALFSAMDAALARVGIAPDRAALVSDAVSELALARPRARRPPARATGPRRAGACAPGRPRRSSPRLRARRGAGGRRETSSSRKLRPPAAFRVLA